MIRRPPRSTQGRSSAASDVYKRQVMTSRLSSHLHIPGAEARKERGGCERFEEKFAPLAFASRKYSSGCVVAASRKQFARLTFGRRFWATRALERNTHLCELIVQDFAIMKEQTIRLDPGLNIITGQSGSGKSIFLEVVAQLCGAVAGEELIRFGAESALVHGCLLYTSPSPRDQRGSRMPSSA